MLFVELLNNANLMLSNPRLKFNSTNYELHAEFGPVFVSFPYHNYYMLMEIPPTSSTNPLVANLLLSYIKEKLFMLVSYPSSKWKTSPHLPHPPLSYFIYILHIVVKLYIINIISTLKIWVGESSIL
jgi:hypothetical protein